MASTPYDFSARRVRLTDDQRHALAGQKQANEERAMLEAQERRVIREDDRRANVAAIRAALIGGELPTLPQRVALAIDLVLGSHTVGEYLTSSIARGVICACGHLADVPITRSDIRHGHWTVTLAATCKAPCDVCAGAKEVARMEDRASLVAMEEEAIDTIQALRAGANALLPSGACLTLLEATEQVTGDPWQRLDTYHLCRYAWGQQHPEQVEQAVKDFAFLLRRCPAWTQSAAVRARPER